MTINATRTKVEIFKVPTFLFAIKLAWECVTWPNEKITWSAQYTVGFHCVASMALQMNYCARRGAFILFVSLFSCLLCVAEGRFGAFRGSRGEALSSAGAHEELWFSQRLDHYNNQDGRVWKQVSRNSGRQGVCIKAAFRLLLTNLFFNVCIKLFNVVDSAIVQLLQRDCWSVRLHWRL